MDTPPGWSQPSNEHKGPGLGPGSGQGSGHGLGSGLGSIRGAESGHQGTYAIGTIALPSVTNHSDRLSNHSTNNHPPNNDELIQPSVRSVTPVQSLFEATTSKQSLVLHPSFVTSHGFPTMAVATTNPSSYETILNTTTTATTTATGGITSSMVSPASPASPPQPVSMSHLQPLPPSSYEVIPSSQSFPSPPSKSQQPQQLPSYTSSRNNNNNNNNNHHSQPSSAIPNLRPTRLPRTTTDTSSPGLGLAPGQALGQALAPGQGLETPGTDLTSPVSSSFIPPRMLIEKYSRVAKVTDVRVNVYYLI